MTPAIKKICIFGLAEGIGHILKLEINKGRIPTDEINLVLSNANEMIKVGQNALYNSKVKLDKSTFKRAKAKINELYADKEEFIITELLSLLFCGLNDLSHFCKDKTLIKSVEDAALNFLTLYDPNLEDEENHKTALEKYDKWIGEN